MIVTQMLLSFGLDVYLLTMENGIFQAAIFVKASLIHKELEV